MARATPKRIKSLVSKVKEYGGYTGLGNGPNGKKNYFHARKARAWNIRENRRVARAAGSKEKGVKLSKVGNIMR